MNVDRYAPATPAEARALARCEVLTRVPAPSVEHRKASVYHAWKRARAYRAAAARTLDVRA